MRIAVLHDEIHTDSRPDERDALVQAALVADALRARGAEVEGAQVSADLSALERQLRANPPDLVFNLVESLAGDGRAIHRVPELLESLGIPFTGCGAAALRTTSEKTLTKQRLRANGLSTPDWLTHGDDAMLNADVAGAWIIKPVWEDASIGMDDTSVARVANQAELLAALESRQARQPFDLFAERFVAGREFNLSLLANGADCAVLAPAEIEFVDYPAGKPRIVGYAAKWDAGSFEYSHTPRRFDSLAQDAPLVAAMRDMARSCWRLFDLRGAARVDFRVDSHGTPWVLEVNANPCLAPDAGFMAAAARSALSPADVIDRLVNDAMTRSSPSGRPYAAYSPGH